MPPYCVFDFRSYDASKKCFYLKCVSCDCLSNLLCATFYLPLLFIKYGHKEI